MHWLRCIGWQWTTFPLPSRFGHGQIHFSSQKGTSRQWQKDCYDHCLWWRMGLQASRKRFRLWKGHSWISLQGQYHHLTLGINELGDQYKIKAVHSAYSAVHAVVVRPNKFNDQNEDFICKELTKTKSNYHKVKTNLSSNLKWFKTFRSTLKTLIPTWTRLVTPSWTPLDMVPSDHSFKLDVNLQLLLTKPD